MQLGWTERRDALSVGSLVSSGKRGSNPGTIWPPALPKRPPNTTEWPLKQRKRKRNQTATPIPPEGRCWPSSNLWPQFPLLCLLEDFLTYAAEVQRTLRALTA